MSDNKRPLVSTETDMSDIKKKNKGCLGKTLKVISWILVIAFIIEACSGDDVYIQNDASSDQPPSAADIKEAAPSTEVTQSKEADIIEKLFFHRYYTDLGTVDIYDFEEREDVLNYIVKIGKDKEILQNGKYASWTNSFLGNEYLFFPESEESNLYYIGEIKNDRPHGFGGLFCLATGSGTYEFAGELLILYIGNFHNGMIDGYGALFAADQSDLTRTITDIANIAAFSDDVGEQIVQYLFNYVSYEGYYSKNKKNGKGNSFDFPLYEDYAVGMRIAFVPGLNRCLDNYIFGPVYPNVTVGEYKDGELNGKVKRYKYNYLVYDGNIEDGEYHAENVIYPNKEFDMSGLLYQNIWGSDILYDFNGFYGPLNDGSKEL